MTESDATAAGDGREMEQRERYRELLEELRTIIPGVQVLFAFLLTAPFAARFEQVDRTGRIAFMVSLVAAALAIALFLTPTAYHRIAPRSQRRERIAVAVRTTVAGLLLLVVAVTAGVFVVVRFVFGPDEARVIATALATVMLLLWVAVPWWRRLRHADS